MKFAIVATYYDRLPQLINTVNSLNKYRRDDFIFVLIDDHSPTEIPRLNNEFPMVSLRMMNKTWHNSSVPFNKGFELALYYNPEFIIIQNAECYHAGDILSHVEQYLKQDNYIAFPCYSLSKDDQLPPETINNRAASFDGDSAWYNHPKYRPVSYHFCSAITAANLIKINGFDERFKDGIGYDDNYLLHQVETLGLRVDLPIEPVVFHQWHYANKNNDAGLIKKNADLFRELSKTKNFRAEHLITPGL